MPKLRRFGIAVSLCIGALALTGTALADTTASLAVGPVPIPNVPVEVCVTQTDVPGGVKDCVTTPAGQSVSLVVNAQADTPTPVVKPPTITPIPCPAGTQGAAARVSTGSVSTTITGTVTIVLNNGTPTTIPIDLVVAPPGQTVTLFACAGLSPGAPPLP
jgi:hypothetical protein